MPRHVMNELLALLTCNGEPVHVIQKVNGREDEHGEELVECFTHLVMRSETLPAA